jgi:AcrR family transcriptional regulator
MVRNACLAAGIGRRTWYGWIEEDKLFAALVNEAREDLSDELEATALKRAKDGSDGMLMFMLKTYRPDKFRARATITVVSPIVREKVARTVHAIRAQLPKELATPLLETLSEVWQ